MPCLPSLIVVLDGPVADQDSRTPRLSTNTPFVDDHDVRSPSATPARARRARTRRSTAVHHAPCDPADQLRHGLPWRIPVWVPESDEPQFPSVAPPQDADIPMPRGLRRRKPQVLPSQRRADPAVRHQRQQGTVLRHARTGYP